MKSRKAKNLPTKEKHKCSVTDIALKMAVVFFLENSARAKTCKVCYNIGSTVNGVMTDETHRRNQQRSDNDD